MTRKWQWSDPIVWVPLLTTVIASIIGPILVLSYQGFFKNSTEDRIPPSQSGNSTNNAQTIDGIASDNGLEPFIREWISFDPNFLFNNVIIEPDKQGNHPLVKIQGHCFAVRCPPTTISIGTYSNGLITGEYDDDNNSTTGNVIAYELKYLEHNDKLQYRVLSGLANNTGIMEKGLLNCQDKCR